MEQRFFKRNKEAYSFENASFLSNLNLARRHTGDGENVMNDFMGMFDGEPTPHLHEASEVVAFCLDATIQVLQSGGDDRTAKPVALLDERNGGFQGINPAGTMSDTTVNRTPLPPHRLLRELSKKRYPANDHPRAVHELHVDRRLLYIANPDPWSILAIARTASATQREYLRGFFYKHIARQTYVGVQIKHATKIPTFGLEFHLPFYVWRTSKSLATDERKSGDGRPLRRSRCVQFLPSAKSSSDGGRLTRTRDYIHEANISCLVSGLDDHFWIGYLFTDTYYNGTNDRESVEYYSSGLPPSPTAFLPDPLTLGRHDANQPEWAPRQYWIMVLEARVRQMTEEQSHLVAQVEKRVAPYTHDYPLGDEDRQLDRSVTHDPDVRRIFNHNIRLIKHIINSLSLLIDVWNRFDEGDVKYLVFPESDDTQGEIYPMALLDKIKKNFDVIRDLRQRMENQKDMLEHLYREVEAGLAQEEFKRIADQARITLWLTPIVISATLLSAQAGTLPYPASFRHFVYQALVIALFILCLLGWPRRRQIWARLILEARRYLPGMFWISWWRPRRRMFWTSWRRPRRRLPTGDVSEDEVELDPYTDAG